MRKFSKSRPQTEVEEFNSMPNIEGKSFKMLSDTRGNIISIESDDPQIAAFLISKGFTE